MTLRASFAALLQLCCSCCSFVAALSLSLYKHVFSCRANPGTRVSVWGERDTTYPCARSLCLSPSSSAAFILSLSLSHTHTLSLSLSFSPHTFCQCRMLHSVVNPHKLLVYETSSYSCMRLQATIVWGLKLLVYEALSYQCRRP